MKPVIWGLECRQQGTIVLNVVSGPGILASDGSMFWTVKSGQQYLITRYWHHQFHFLVFPFKIDYVLSSCHFEC